MKRCNYCNDLIDDDAIFCPSCGKRIVKGKLKSKKAATLLAIFFAPLGIHNFYLGYYAKAITQLSMALLTFIAFIFALFTFDPKVSITLFSIFAYSLVFLFVWGIIEAVLILNGNIRAKNGDILI